MRSGYGLLMLSLVRSDDSEASMNTMDRLDRELDEMNSGINPTLDGYNDHNDPDNDDEQEDDPDEYHESAVELTATRSEAGRWSSFTPSDDIILDVAENFNMNQNPGKSLLNE